MPRTKKVAEGIPTIDVSLVVVRAGDDESGQEIAVNTANKVQVNPQTEETDPIRLMKGRRLLAQKLGETIITGHQITLTDNVFIPELVVIFQGGTIEDNEGTGNLRYIPPVAGSKDKGQVFELDCYSAVYDASGQIEKYEKTTYPNCQGTPISFSSEDDVFRLPEYTINSAPRTGQPPYTIEYMDDLPDFSTNYSEDELQHIEPVVEMSSSTGKTPKMSVPSIENKDE